MTSSPGANRVVVDTRGIGTLVIDDNTSTLYAVTRTLENGTPLH